MVSPCALKVYKALAKPYDALGEVFRAGSLSRLKAEINAGTVVWQAVSHPYVLLDCILFVAANLLVRTTMLVLSFKP